MPCLTDGQDAYGHALYDFHVDGSGYELDERDDGFIGQGDVAHYFTAFRQWPACQKEGIRLVRGRVLDVGCGAGRCCLHLQENGHDVLGIDVSPLALKVCRERGVRKLKQLGVTQVTRSLGRFNTILMFGNNFGLFGSFRRARWLLRRFRGLTTSDARIVAESTDPYATDSPEHVAYHRLNERRGRMGGQIRLRVRYRHYATPWFDYLLASQDEVREIVDGTGWRVERFIDGDAGHYVVVIEKER